MSFWDQNMPVGMFLRSNWTATQIASPENLLTIETYMDETGIVWLSLSRRMAVR